MDASSRPQPFVRVPHEPSSARKSTRRTAPVTPLRVAPKPAAVVAKAASVMTYDNAAVLMWNHYKDRRAQYITDIRLFREHIIAELMRGAPEETAFEPYLKPVEDELPVSNPRRRAA